MDILYLLIPMSTVLVLLIIGVFGWAVNNGQLDDLEREGQRILQADAEPIDSDQVISVSDHQQSAQFPNSKSSS
jgi:cbb3-type cytochrome oxidase maturation protein